jgi:hypothetical protein
MWHSLRGVSPGLWHAVQEIYEEGRRALRASHGIGLCEKVLLRSISVVHADA